MGRLNTLNRDIENTEGYLSKMRDNMESSKRKESRLDELMDRLQASDEKNRR